MFSCGTAVIFLRLPLHFFLLLLVSPIMTNALSTTCKLENGDRNMHLDVYVNLTFVVMVLKVKFLELYNPALLSLRDTACDCNLCWF